MRSLSQRKYWIGASPIGNTEYYKYIRANFTANLSWTFHIYSVTANASRTIDHLNSSFKRVSLYLRKLTYETQVRPKLEYASSISKLYQKFLIG